MKTLNDKAMATEQNMPKTIACMWKREAENFRARPAEIERDDENATSKNKEISKDLCGK